MGYMKYLRPLYLLAALFVPPVFKNCHGNNPQ
jgi:hypothetical protein